MELAEAQVIKQGNSYHVQHGDDKGLYVEFTTETVQDSKATVAEGRPIFKEKEYITIHVMGDKTKVVKRPVDLIGNGTMPADNERFPRQYQAFKNQQKEVSIGTPITEWPPITKGEAMGLKALNFHTLEDLANAGDNNINFLGGREYREKAKAWIAQAKDGSGLEKLQAENKDLKTQMEALQNQMKALIDEQNKPKRGRPPKGIEDGEDVS